MEELVVGVIEGQLPTPLGLARAAAHHPGLSVRTLSPNEPASEAVAGLIVDVPVEQRAGILQGLAGRWRVPLVVEFPLAIDLESAQAVGPSDGIIAANPLRYALHTRRLLEELSAADDPLQTFFAAWRFRGPALSKDALPQLLDCIEGLSQGEPTRVSAMQHREPEVLTVTLRYRSGVLGSIELGNHLPPSFPSGSELVVECFGRENAYVCVPGNQAVQLYGQEHAQFDWQPEPADMIVAAFAAWLRGGPRPIGSVANDVSVLRLVDRIGKAFGGGGEVLCPQDSDALVV